MAACAFAEIALNDNKAPPAWMVSLLGLVRHLRLGIVETMEGPDRWENCGWVW